MTPSSYRPQLAVLIRQGKIAELREFLASLRNANFRAASLVLAEGELWQGVANFWDFAATLVQANNKAYLGTMLKAAVASRNYLPTNAFAEVCLTDIDRKKVLEGLLHYASSPAEASNLLRLFPIEPTSIVESILFRVGSSVCYFALFNLLKQHDDSPAYLRRFGVELIRKGDKRSFNLACIIKEYFGLPELPGTFSLSLQPYELSRLDTSFETFQTIVNK